MGFAHSWTPRKRCATRHREHFGTARTRACLRCRCCCCPKIPRNETLAHHDAAHHIYIHIRWWHTRRDFARRWPIGWCTGTRQYRDVLRFERHSIVYRMRRSYLRKHCRQIRVVGLEGDNHRRKRCRRDTSSTERGQSRERKTHTYHWKHRDGQRRITSRRI